MGEVYRAYDRKLGREVAIKILPEAFAQDAAKLTRFDREARMLAAVNHPKVPIGWNLPRRADLSGEPQRLQEQAPLAAADPHEK